MSRSDDEFVQHIKARLQADAEPLAASLQQRLDELRHQAMQPASTRGQANRAEEQPTATLQKALRDAEQLPTELQQRLDRSREQALARAKIRQADRASSWWRRLLGQADQTSRSASSAFGNAYGGLATVCLTLTVAAALWFSAADPEQLPLAQGDGLLASADELELYENLDFYLWLEENELVN
jgi:hypothetical protein